MESEERPEAEERPDSARPIVPAPIHRRVAEALDDPKNRTKADVLRAAGFAETTVRAKPGLTLAGKGVQIAIRERREERLATARRVKNKGLTRLDEALDSPEVTVQEAALAAKVGHEIAKDEPEQDERPDAAQLRLFERRVPRALHRGYLLGVLACSEMGHENALKVLSRVRERFEDRLPPLPFESRGEAPRHRRYIAGDA